MVSKIPCSLLHLACVLPLFLSISEEMPAAVLCAPNSAVEDAKDSRAVEKGLGT